MESPDALNKFPQIDYAADKGAGGEPETPPGITPEQEAMLLNANRELGMFGRSRIEDDEGADLYGATFALLDSLKKDAKEQTPERLKELGANFDSGLAYEIETILENYANLYNPADWELKRQIGEITSTARKFERRIKVLEKAKQDKRNRFPNIDTKLEIARSAYEKLRWAKGIETVLSGCMISTATYYAQETHMGNVPKIKVTGEDNQEAFFATLEGTGAKPTSEYLVSRSEVIKMQDDAMDLSLMIAAVQQKEVEIEVDYDTAKIPVTGPRERTSMVLSPKQEQLIREIFATRYDEDVKSAAGQVIHRKGDIIMVKWIDPVTGNPHEVPKEILNYFCMDKTSDENKRRLFALMTATVRHGALDAIERPDADIGVIANTVRIDARRMAETDYFSPNIYQDSRERYANLAVRTIIAKHLGDMSGGELGWGWKYEKTDWDELEPWEKEMFESAKEYDWVIVDGQRVQKFFVTLRISELGSIYSVDDIPSPFYPERHVADYQANVESTAEMMWGLADKFRREVRYHRPDWSPNLEEYAKSNPILKEQLELLFGVGYEDKLALVGVPYADKLSRNGVPFKKDGQDEKGLDLPGTINGMDKRLMAFAFKYRRAWPTWVDVNGTPYAIPLFYPPFWFSLNIMRSAGENGKKPSQVPSEWERLWEGKKMSQIDWRKFANEFVDWKNVNGAQLARTLVLLFLSYKFSREAQAAFETYFTRTFDIKAFTDWEKRWRLGGRGEEAIAGILGLLTFAAFATKVVIDKIGTGELADPTKTSTEKRNLRVALKRALATLELNAMYQPKTKGVSKLDKFGGGGVKNFRGAFAMFHRLYAVIETDWSIKASLQTSDHLRQTEVQVGEDIDKVLDDNKV